MKHVFNAVALALIAFIGTANAHPPDGHGNHADHHASAAMMRPWTSAKTGEVVRGAFLASRSVDGVTRVSIERENGDVVEFPLADLTEADRAEASRRIDEVKAINMRLGGAITPPTGAKQERPAQASPFDFFAPRVQTRWDANWLYVESDGLPHDPWSYAPMVGIRSWQQQVPLPQPYVGDNAWRIPLAPELSDHPISGRTALYRGAIALAANGVPIFNALNNRGDDTYKAGELDEYGGHSGRGDDYHYHIAPLQIQKIVGNKNPIAYALDGFPLYGLFDPAAKSGDSNACPLGGTEKLDEFNGHFGAPAQNSAPGVKGLYHYHASLGYPYINGGVRGKVTVRDDQIEPQPRVTPIRQWLQPLRGASITGFKALAENAWSLEYTLGGAKHLVNFRIEGAGQDARYVFEFVDPDGTKKTETYQARPRDQPAGEGRGRRDRPPAENRDPPRRPAENDHASAPTAPIAKPADGFVLTSPDAVDLRLSVECTCDGMSRSPSLAWQGAPKGARFFAVVMHHVPPEGGAHVYMVVANIPASGGSGELKTGDTTTGIWGPNTVNRRNEYAPPCSKGPGDKLYTLTLYALSKEVAIPKDQALTRDALLTAIKDSTLATASLDVKYARQNPGRKEAR